MKEHAKIMMAIPSRDVWKSDFGVSFATMLCATVIARPKLQFIINNAKGANLAMNRIDLCQRAIKAKCDYLLFLDDDMRLPMDTALMLLKADKDIVAANCARREFPPAPTAKDFDGSLIYTTAKSSGLQKVKSVGTGVMMIRLDILKDIPEPWFCEDPVARIGEDVWFCRAAQAAGRDIWIDHDLSKGVVHIGEFEYTHQLCDQWEGKIND